MSVAPHKKILIAVTGGIAAYKSVSLVRLFVKAGNSVRVIMTPSATEFVGKTTFAALTDYPVFSTFTDKETGGWHSHVAFAEWADAIVVAPATASTISKIAYGQADNLVIATCMSAKSPVFVAPAMDLDMYRHPSTKNNIATLQSYGLHVIPPQSGFLASRLEGKGRMEEPEKIAQTVLSYLTP